jgi:hypothetical protein
MKTKKEPETVEIGIELENGAIIHTECETINMITICDNILKHGYKTTTDIYNHDFTWYPPHKIARLKIKHND